jgi:hypothetical protein
VRELEEEQLGRVQFLAAERDVLFVQREFVPLRRGERSNDSGIVGRQLSPGLAHDGSYFSQQPVLTTILSKFCFYYY